MKFVADENFRFRVVSWLRLKGHTVIIPKKGTSDTDVFSLVKKEKAILLTHDKDFLRSGEFPPHETEGIFVFRIHPPVLLSIMEAIDNFLSREEEKNFLKKLVVIYSEENWEIFS